MVMFAMIASLAIIFIWSFITARKHGKNGLIWGSISLAVTIVIGVVTTLLQVAILESMAEDVRRGVMTLAEAKEDRKSVINIFAVVHWVVVVLVVFLMHKKFIKP